jgi:transcriptional regulator with XRE-family HTH domain
VTALRPASEDARFGELVAGLLGARGWSQRDLARAVDVDPAHICRLLRPGARSVSPELLVRVAEALGVPPEHFAEYREWRVVEAVRQDAALRERLFRSLAAAA